MYYLPVWFHSRSICDTMPIRCSISHDNCSQRAVTNETSMGSHRVSMIFGRKKTRSSKLLNVNQIPNTQWSYYTSLHFSISSLKTRAHIIQGDTDPKDLSLPATLFSYRVWEREQRSPLTQYSKFHNHQDIAEVCVYACTGKYIATEITYKKMHPMTEDFCFHFVLCSGQYYLAH